MLVRRTRFPKAIQSETDLPLCARLQKMLLIIKPSSLIIQYLCWTAMPHWLNSQNFPSVSVKFSVKLRGNFLPSLLPLIPPHFLPHFLPFSLISFLFPSFSIFYLSLSSTVITLWFSFFLLLPHSFSFFFPLSFYHSSDPISLSFFSFPSLFHNFLVLLSFPSKY